MTENITYPHTRVVTRNSYLQLMRTDSNSTEKLYLQLMRTGSTGMEFSSFVFTLFQPQKTVEEKSISRREEEAVEAAERVNSVNVRECISQRASRDVWVPVL